MDRLIKQYLRSLSDENKKQNLISRKTSVEDLEQHVKDSMQLLEWYSMAGAQAVDVGSGAGFPGLVLAMAEPSCRMTLVEADLKKSGFLQRVIADLDIPNVRVIRSRIEVLGQAGEHRGFYDLGTSRAVASMRILLEYGLPLIKIGGCLFLWKGSNYQAEIDEATMALQILGGQVEAVHPYNLVNVQDRIIVVVRKICPTPPQYPRRIGIPAKRPL